jgi:hypothetical protein
VSVSGGWTPSYLKTDHDRLWFDEGLRCGWRLRRPAARFWRIWGVRHARWVLQLYRVWQWGRRWQQMDVCISLAYEDWSAYAIRRGWL